MIQALWSLDQQFQNKNGSILTHGKIYVYYKGRTALATTYNDEDGTVVNPNPILLDNNGRAACFASSAYSYTIVVCDAYGKELFSYDLTLHDVVETADKVFIIGSDGSVVVDPTTLPNGIQYDLSVNTDVIATKQSVDDVKDDLDDLTDIVENHTTEIGQLQDDVDDIEDTLANKKDKQTAKTFNGAATKTIKKITQNADGEMNVEFEDIDLPPEVPNVEITSPNGTIDVQSSTDVQTNTKTFEIDIKNGDPVWHYWTGDNAWTVISTAAWTQINRPAIGAGTNPHQWNPDIKRGIYDAKAHFTVTFHNSDNSKTIPNQIIQVGFRAKFVGKNDPTAIRYEDLGAWTYDPTLYTTEPYQYNFAQESIRQNHDTSKILNVANYWGDTEFNVYFEAALLNTDGGVSTPQSIDNVLYAEITYFGYHEVKGAVQAAGGGGTEYTAGDAIDITNDTINVKVNPASGIDIVDDKLVVKVGNGLTIEPGSGAIGINSEVTDVVETVEKLKTDLDTQITVNFDMPNITHTYDFANRSVTTLTNGATMLCQAFTIPINHEIRVQTVGEEEPTLLGIYAKQQFVHKIMLALYVYDFESGFTDYVGDTGPVYVQAGRNEYPLVHKNPNITELTSKCVYYASLYLPSTSQSNGLYLASCPSYSDASSINATPRFTVGVENITYNNLEIDMTDATTGRLDYNDGLGNYYIGPWTDSYNERPSAPRFFLQVRNGTAAEPYVPAAPFTTLGASAMPTSSDLCSNLPNFTPSQSNSCFRDVTPESDCDVTYFEWLDDTSSAAGWVQSNCVYNSGFDTNLSGNNNVVTNLGEVTTIDGHSLYRHRLTFGTALHLTANVTYRFLCEAFTDTGYVFSRSTNTNTIHVTNNGWYVDLQDMTRYNNIIGKYIKICVDGTDYEV